MEATYYVFKYLVINHDTMKCVFSSCPGLGYYGLKSRPELESSDPSDMGEAALICPGPPTMRDLCTRRHCCPHDPAGSFPWGAPRPAPSSRSSGVVLAAFALPWGCDPYTPTFPLPGLLGLMRALCIDIGILISNPAFGVGFLCDLWQVK